MMNTETTCAVQNPAGLVVAQQPLSTWQMLGGVLLIASVGASAYHGYVRNQSVPLGIWWGFMGALAPVIAPAIAFGQGFGKVRPGLVRAR